jgi:hypothetical protein
MQSNSIKKVVPIVGLLKCLPYVTIQFNFEPIMTPKFKLERKLKTFVERIKAELYENYSFVAAKDVSDKLVSTISDLDYNTHKKSIVILVSAEEQKVYYRDERVADQFFVSESFHYRDLVHYKKNEPEYLLLVPGGNEASVYKGKGEILTRILHNVPNPKIINELNEKDQKFTFIEQKIGTKTFLESVDRNLSLLLNAFPFPVFVLSSKEVISDYSQLTLNYDSICHYIEGAFNEASENEFRKAIEPFVKDWHKVKEKYLVQKLETASEEGRVAVGIQDVWNLAKRKNVKHLIIEAGYEYHSYLGKGIIIYAEEATKNAYFKDAVEDIIDKVLEDGGEIDFVSKEGLSDFLHIAAIQNY